VGEQLALLPGYLTAHLELSLAALLVGFCVSVPLGIVISRVPWLEQPVLGVAATVQTIPSLALLALMVPLLGALGMTSIGFLPAFVALVLYSMLPVLRNTVTGIAAVDPALLEAARGVGMSARDQLLRVELPLALPMIVAGIRTATVWTVGTATLATPVGATSLGNYIFSGLQTRNLNAVLVGCVAAAALALVLDNLAALVHSGVERRSRPRTAVALAGFVALYLYAGASLGRRVLGEERDTLVVGSKTFSEQYVLAEMLAQRVRAQAGTSVELRPSLGSTVVFDALRDGSVDFYVDYSGTIWTNVMKRADEPPRRAEMLRQIEVFLSERHGITLVCALGFENAYALAMRRDKSMALGVRTLGHLTSAAPRLSIGGDYEFFGRPEWKRVRETYGLSFREQRSMDSSLMYEAVRGGSVDVISAFTTDGRIAAFDLVLLEDDRQAIPPYDAIVLASRRVSRDYPAVLEALRSLSGRIDASEMRRMNLAVDRDHHAPRDVAADFLERLAVTPAASANP
jgi:osmoprotectant transport system permease protein